MFLFRDVLLSEAEGKEAKEGSLGKDRIGAFSNGEHAIAVALPPLAAYALSFLIIGVYWVAHHLSLSGFSLRGMFE